MMSPDINNIAIITLEGGDYCCIIYDVSKSDIIHFLENLVLDDHGFI